MSDTKSTTATSDNTAVETKDSPKKADTAAKATTTSDKSKKEDKPATAKSQPASKAKTAAEPVSKEIAKEEVKASKSPEQPTESIEPIEPIVETIPVEQVQAFPVTVTLTRSVGTYRGPSESFLGKSFGGTAQLSDRTSDGQYYKVSYVRSGVGRVTGYMLCREVDSCRF